MNNNVFELVEVDNNQVILKVNADNNLVIARHPYINSKMDYITLTRGDSHTLTIINKDGSTFSFHWGVGGHTLISDNLERLRDAVIDFVEYDNHIVIGLVTDKYDGVSIFYNSNFGEWQITFRTAYGNAYHRSKKAKSLLDMTEEAKKYVKVKCWNRKIAETGIDVWVATL